MKILFAGIIARYPFGGVTWCSLMYLLGLRALGHEVFYIEDTGECVYDPVQNTRSLDPSYGTRYIHSALEPFGLGDRWSFVNYDGTYHGRAPRPCGRICADADLFINLSGGSWFWRDEYARIPRRVFIDSDPAFTQLAIAKGEAVVRRVLPRLRSPVHVRREHRHAGLRCPGRRLRVAQDVAAGRARLWRTAAPPARPLHDGDDLADRELHRRGRQQGPGVRNGSSTCPAHRAAASSWRSTGRRRCCANTAGRRSTRWACRASLWDYRDFIQGSKAEFGVAKHTYVARRSGWFSDRTECYLAAGRPGARAGHRLERAPAGGRGPARLLDAGGSAGRLDRIDRDYPRHARRRARSRASTSTPHACCRVLGEGLRMNRLARVQRPLRSRTSRRSPRRSRRPSPARSRR